MQLTKLLRTLVLTLDVTMGRKCGMLTVEHIAAFTIKHSSLPRRLRTAALGKSVLISPEEALAQLPVYVAGAEIIPVIVKPATPVVPAGDPSPSNADSEFSDVHAMDLTSGNLECVVYRSVNL